MDIKWGLRPAPIIDQLVDGGPFGFTMLMADSGAGKTTIAANMAAAVALGERCFGSLEVEQGSVVIIECERTAFMVIETLKALVHPDKWQTANQNIKVIQKKDNEIDWDIHSPADRERILGLIYQYSPKLVIFDSVLFMCNTSDGEYGIFRKLFMEIMEHGASVVGLMHTTSKSTSDTWTNAYGPTGKELARWASCRLGFNRIGESDYSYIAGPTRRFGNVVLFTTYIPDSRRLFTIHKLQIPVRYQGQLPNATSEPAVRMLERLRILAKSKHINTTELARLLGVHRRNFSYWGTGRNNASLEHYEAMKRLYEKLK